MTINTQTVIATNRFGLGARPGDLKSVGSDGRDWLIEQTRHKHLLLKSVGKVPDSKAALLEFMGFRKKTMEARQSGKTNSANPKDVMKMGQAMRPMYLQHIYARTVQAMKTESPVYERLVHFWSNHFAVSVDNPQMFGIAGSLEFEAIRPNVNGYFSDMLLAAEKHPAMLIYLNNHQSVGPNSTFAKQAGKRVHQRKFDINENLGREILELHTLGVNGGYDQQDVTRFAKVISGWSIGGMYPRLPFSGDAGEFDFINLVHEPGKQKVLNKTYNQAGIKQGETLLKDLAKHSSTARHLATKLARHFIADQPPKEVIQRLSKVYLDSEGYLPAVYEALITSDEAWQEPFAKYKTPNEFIYSMFRAIDYRPEQAQQILQPLVVLGQQPFKPGSPAGWPDTAKEWSGGEALLKRIELATAIGNRLGNRVDPDKLANDILGPNLGDHSRTAINNAESASQGIALLFASPEFQRR